MKKDKDLLSIEFSDRPIVCNQRGLCGGPGTSTAGVNWLGNPPFSWTDLTPEAGRGERSKRRTKPKRVQSFPTARKRQYIAMSVFVHLPFRMAESRIIKNITVSGPFLSVDFSFQETLSSSQHTPIHLSHTPKPSQSDARTEIENRTCGPRPCNWRVLSPTS